MALLFSPQDVVVEDDDLVHVTYSPESAWKAVQDQPENYRSGSYHKTSVSGATATISFTGSFIAYYSDYNYNHGNFVVALDGVVISQLSTHNTYLIKQQLIFGTFVSDGTHNLAITNTEDGHIVGVDYFVYHPVETTLGTFSSSSATAKGQTLDPAAVTGIAFGAAASAIMLVLCLVALRRRADHASTARKRRDKAGETLN
ncbi:hypothetical protein AURDEDRAFT_165637 [Auricularia subglabra TFB-10046 SS5]|nr:hypothetical protein AURDEDRAFT_165637 [Auricularia subglabra TFB-10046 SS5]